MNYTVEDLYYLRNGPDAPPCPQPKRLMWFAYAMAIVAGEVESRKFEGLAGFGRSGPAPRTGTQIRMPGGRVGTKPGRTSEG